MLRGKTSTRQPRRVTKKLSDTRFQDEQLCLERVGGPASGESVDTPGPAQWGKLPLLVGKNGMKKKSPIGDRNQSEKDHAPGTSMGGRGPTWAQAQQKKKNKRDPGEKKQATSENAQTPAPQMLNKTSTGSRAKKGSEITEKNRPPASKNCAQFETDSERSQKPGRNQGLQTAKKTPNRNLFQTQIPAPEKRDELNSYDMEKNTTRKK